MKDQKGTGEVRIISSWRIKFLPVWKYCDFLENVWYYEEKAQIVTLNIGEINYNY